MITENLGQSVEDAAKELLKAFESADIPNSEDKNLPRTKLTDEAVKLAAWTCAEALRRESVRINPEREKFWISVQGYINE